MARRKDKEKVLLLRSKGMSYSQIKEELDIPKSTLSNWLSEYPLSKERIRELRDLNPRRIERCRNTKRKNREKELEGYYRKASRKIHSLNERELFLTGLFLYWGEGGKTKRYSVSLSNTDPAVLKFFIKWLISLGVPKEKIKGHIHIYKDMDYEKILEYWSTTLDIEEAQFRNPYIKSTNQAGLSYKSGFRKGTCNIFYDKKEIAYLVHMGLKYLQDRVLSDIWKSDKGV